MKATGHRIGGPADDALLINMRKLTEVTIDSNARERAVQRELVARFAPGRSVSASGCVLEARTMSWLREFRRPGVFLAGREYLESHFTVRFRDRCPG